MPVPCPAAPAGKRKNQSEFERQAIEAGASVGLGRVATTDGGSRGKQAKSVRTRRGRGGPTRPAFNRRKMETGLRMFLRGLGPVVSRRDLRETPRLVTRAFSDELLAGYLQDGHPLLEPLLDAPPEALVVVRGVRFVSVCRHHLLPFQGSASVAYLPDSRMAGFSSVARLVDTLARRLQLQEELSEQILDRLEESLAPRGSACLLEATHQCMTCRGARQRDSRVATLRLRGIFTKDRGLRREVVSLLQAPPGAGWEAR